jgi:hypothetical protein
MGIYYNPDEGFSPSSWMGTIAGEMFNQYLNYWGQQNERRSPDITPESREKFGRLIALADALRPCLHSLSVDRGALDRVRDLLRGGNSADLSDADASEIAGLLTSHPIVEHGIAIHLASEAADELLTGAESRVGLLAELLAQRSLSDRAAAYLDRATRLYLWGFEPESVVMCGCVLEAAYPERFSELDMLRLQIQKKGDEYEPHQYEGAALSSRIFTTAQRSLARTIRRARNDVLHAVPAVALSARDALLGTAQLLESLFPRLPD